MKCIVNLIILSNQNIEVLKLVREKIVKIKEYKYIKEGKEKLSELESKEIESLKKL